MLLGYLHSKLRVEAVELDAIVISSENLLYFLKKCG